MARITKNEKSETKRVVKKKKDPLPKEQLTSLNEKIVNKEVADPQPIVEVKTEDTEVKIPISQIISITKIDRRTLKSYCEKTNIEFSNDGIYLQDLLDIFFAKANSMDGRRAKGKFKLDGIEGITDEMRKEIDSYNSDPYAPKGPIHIADPARYNLYWNAAKTWISYQVQCNRYIAVADVYDILQQSLQKMSELFDNLQDKIDSSFSENPEVQSSVNIWRMECMINIYEQLLDAVDKFKLESENPDRVLKQRIEIEKEANAMKEALLDRIEKEKEYEQEELEKRLKEEILEESSNIESVDFNENIETVLEILDK